MRLLSDWRHAARVFERNPGLATVAIGSLALGIGVGSAVFSVADARFLRPLAVSDPRGLVDVFARSETGQPDRLSYAEALDIAGAPSVAAIAAYDVRGAVLQRGDDLEMLVLEGVSDSYFSTLGVKAAVGRVIGPGVDQGLPAPAVVISDRLWRGRFGADRALVGRGIELSARTYTLVGVLPAQFRGLDRGIVHDVWISLDTWSRFYGSRQSLESRGARNFSVVARLQPDSTLQQAASELQVLNARWAQAYPDTNRGRTLHATRSLEIAGEASPVVLMLLGGAVLLMLIGCFNVSTLLLGLTDARRGELAIRQALGASRADIARQMLAESALLSFAGLAGGLGVAALLVRAAPALLPPSPVAIDYGVGLDARVLLCAAAFGIVSALIGGAAPALRAGNLTAGPSWRVTEAAPGTRRLLSLPTALVAAQVALAIVAVNSAALLVGSFDGVRTASRGFDTGRNLLALQLAMGEERGDLSRWTTELDAARQRALGLPDVRQASYVRRLPMAGYGGGATIQVSLPGAEGRPLRYNQAGPGFLETLGVHLQRGRFFDDAEHAARVPVVVVSETLARAFFAGAEPIGRRLLVEGEPHAIVGVVADAPISRLHEQPQPFLYLPYSRKPTSDTALLVETAGDPAALATALKGIVRDTCPGTRVLATTTLRRHMQEALHADWLPAVLGTGLALLGVLLALAGLYATVSRLAQRRTREIGVRMVLGAAGSEVMRLVLREGLALSSIGTVFGLTAAVATAVLLRSMLHGTSPLDPRALATSAAVAVLMGVVAAAGPAWRAVHTDPARALRAE